MFWYKILVTAWLDWITSCQTCIIIKLTYIIFGSFFKKLYNNSACVKNWTIVMSHTHRVSMFSGYCEIAIYLNFNRQYFDIYFVRAFFSNHFHSFSSGLLLFISCSMRFSVRCFQYFIFVLRIFSLICS